MFNVAQDSSAAHSERHLDSFSFESAASASVVSASLVTSGLFYESETATSASCDSVALESLASAGLSWDSELDGLSWVWLSTVAAFSSVTASDSLVSVPGDAS
jgi:hypothetical protein